MRIAVSGCGIAGTTIAFFLSQQGHEVVIFEQAAKCSPVGAGLLLQPSGQSVLQEMGLLDSLAIESAVIEGLTALRRGRFKGTRRLVELRYADLDPKLHALGVHRGRLFELLWQACRNAGVQLVNSARVTGLQHDSKSGKVSLEIDSPDSDATARANFDFLVVADGANSLIRNQLGTRVRTKEYNYGALWFTGASVFQPSHLFQVVQGTHRLIGLLPIGNNECSYFWGLPLKSVHRDSFESLQREGIDSWKLTALRLCPESASILSRIESFGDLTFTRYRHVDMKKHTGSKVIVLGDAAHATSPHLGQGVNLGLEDALILARATERATDFESAIHEYERIRRRKLRYYQQLTRLLSPFFQSSGSWRGVFRDSVLPWFPKIPWVRRQMLKTLCGTKPGWWS